jgi:hypothetical protein
MHSTKKRREEETSGWEARFEDVAARGARARREQAATALQRRRRDVNRRCAEEGEERRWQVGPGKIKNSKETPNSN